MSQGPSQRNDYLIPLQTPGTALDVLDAARQAVLDIQTESEAAVKAACAETAEAKQALVALRSEMSALQQERDRWRGDCEQYRARAQQLEAGMQRQRDHTQQLNREVMELYRDLRAADPPTLIVRIGMKLVGAESGLYTDATGRRTVTSIGLDNMPEPVAQALYRYTQQAAQSEDPVVVNEARQLPDGSSLVNLAALPVALQNELHGVLLVANKREGPFTDHDTELLLSIGKHAGIALENQRLHAALGEAYLATIAVLADAIEAKDAYTRGHCEGVAATAMRVAEHLGWKNESLDQIRYAALLHDVGKIGIPDGILLKPGRLLPEEFTVIQSHATIGHDLVSRVPSLVDIAPYVLHHHERYDGSGYPEGLSGDGIPLGARIVGAVDAVDAMTTPRPYREPVSMTDALTELRRCSGTQFDPDVVDGVVAVLSGQSSVVRDMPVG
jgi:HD-GYP domain-containing protein (c-di-GMP phosphodiesterase class II)